MSAPDRGSIESMRLCLAAVCSAVADWTWIRMDYEHRALGGFDEAAWLRRLRSRTEDLQRGLGVLLEELARREQRLARDPETWGQR